MYVTIVTSGPDAIGLKPADQAIPILLFNIISWSLYIQAVNYNNIESHGDNQIEPHLVI